MTTQQSTRSDHEWIQTFTGRQFWPLDPRPEDVDIYDIAHALANLCRYTGHTRSFYSVAQHCVLMSDAAPPEYALDCLMHDAPEAYFADVARPVKRRLNLAAVEGPIMRAIAERFGLTWPEPEYVKHADLVMLATERRDLMAAPPVPWISIENVEPLHGRIIPWGPRLAELAFLNTWERLTKGGAADGR